MIGFSSARARRSWLYHCCCLPWCCCHHPRCCCHHPRCSCCCCCCCRHRHRPRPPPCPCQADRPYRGPTFSNSKNLYINRGYRRFQIAKKPWKTTCLVPNDETPERWSIFPFAQKKWKTPLRDYYLLPETTCLILTYTMLSL